MLRFLSRFRGSRAMLHSSTSSGGVTEFRVYREGEEGKVMSRVCGGSLSPMKPHKGDWAGLLCPFYGWRN